MHQMMKTACSGDQDSGERQEQHFQMQRRQACWGLSSVTQVLLGFSGAAGIVVVFTLLFVSGWGYGTQLLVGCAGSMGVLLVVSYVIHWMQVVVKIKQDKVARKKELEGKPHVKASAMLSILLLERQTRSYTDKIPMHYNDEYGINLI